ncbi:MAG: DUF2905 domain-containing protein [Dechloromonas sp.]|nr:MAG: DUF2905 domain-containing protein [Dechloromonas sp.]
MRLSPRKARQTMLKWILTLVVAIFLLGILTPHLARFIRFGRLPGDFAFRFRGRTYAFPFVSILLFSLLLWLLSRVF